jgi:hypothetical protein
MLFDLRSRGRRRTVQVVYVGLALLFLVGFLGFGVGAGGFGGGGIFEGVFGKKEGSKSSFSAQISAAEKQVRKNPRDAEGWAKLADTRLHQASSPEYFDENTGYTAAGKALLLKVVDAWNRYMALNPPKPNVRVAQEMLGVYGQGGLNQPAQNVQLLQQVVIPAKPTSATLYGELAAYAYQANNTRVGDLASEKSVALSPASQRARVKEQLERIKANPTGNPENEKLKGTVGGKTYNFKRTKGGKLLATPAPTPAPKKK